MKLEQLEALLNMPHDCDIDLWNVSLILIHEVERLYSVNASYSNNINNHWVTLNSDKVTLTLNTKNKL